MNFSKLFVAGILFVCFAASAVRAETPFDVTLCVAGPVTTITSSEELTILGVELKGILMSNHDNKVFDNVVYHFIGVSGISAGQVDGRGYSKMIDTNGDSIFTQTTTLGPLAKPEWKMKLLQGTGKWKGIADGGDVTQITKRSPVVEGSYRACYRIVGAFELPR